MQYEHIRYEVAERIATVTLNRPERLNAVSFRMIDELTDAVDRADRDDEVRAVIFTGAGRAYSAGTDLSGGGMNATAADYKPLQGTNRDSGGALTIRIFDSMKPVIGAINGTCVGIGVTMTLPMDIRIASAEARFALPFARRGIVPESCAHWFLPRIVGISRALSWTVTGRFFTAQEALEAGLVEEILPPERLLPRAREIAREIADNTSAVSVAMARQMMWRMLSADHPIEANRLESQALAALVPAADTREGVAAFKEKRPARFTLRPSADMPAFYPWWRNPEF
ncbi:MAG: enoyl-CoA hydratase-related protein [Gammaproteobacteria bacterium]